LLSISIANSSVLHSDSRTLPYVLTKELLYTLYLITGVYYTLHTMLPQNLESVSIYVLTKLYGAYIYTHMIFILS